MFPEWGFVDTLAQYSSINHDSGAHRVRRRTRTPRCRACTRWTRSSSASSCSALVRSRLAKALWLAWPVWVGVRGHLDRQPLLARRRRRLRCSRSPTGFALRRVRSAAPPQPPHDATSGPGVRAGAASASSTGSSRSTRRPRARSSQRSMRGVAKTKLTPDMLTLAGVSLCLAGAVLVGFEERNEKLFFWLGGVAVRRRLGRGHPRRRARARREQGDGLRRVPRLDLRPARRGRDARRDRPRLHARRERGRARRDVRRGDRLVPRLVHAREGRGARSPRRRRLRLPRRARRPHLGRPRPRAVGAAAVADLRRSPRWPGSRSSSGCCSSAASCASSPSRPSEPGVT